MASVGGHPTLGPRIGLGVKPTLGPKIGLGVEPKVRTRRGRQGYVEKPDTKLYVTAEVGDFLRCRKQFGEQAIDDTLRRLLGMKKRTPA